MSVDIEPFELSFRRPFTVEVAQILKIKNPNKSPVAFKVKTTAPKQYCVRPNSGRVEPGQDVEVTVLLQAMKQDPPMDVKCKDKFLVQSAPITGDKEFASIANILDTTDKSLVQERKIRVNWLAADEGAGAAVPIVATPSRQSLANGHDNTPDVSRAYSSPGEDNQSTSPAPPAYTSDNDAKDDSPVREQSTAPGTTAAVTNAVQLTYEELKAKLQQAEAQVAAFQQSGGLRQRIKTESEKIPNAQQVTTAVRQGVEGVPVQVVMALCVLSFLLAYFFF